MEYSLENQTMGMQTLIDGYIDYSAEVIIGRALPNLLDGLKPVHRRILYTAKTSHKMNKGGKSIQVKSAALVGDVMLLHPHGDAAIYDALVLMTDSNGSMGVPLFKGQGNFGRYNKDMMPAAYRYTELSLSERADAYFGEMEGIKMVLSEDASTTEPEVLPVSFPAILCNATSGIAVGFGTRFPSFNFNDVIDLTIEYIKDGECSTVICPDFVHGGYYVRNNKELEKLMRIGKAKLKLRGKVEVDGKSIYVREVPVSTTFTSIKDQLNNANISSIRGNVGDLSDFVHGDGLIAECTSKNRVDETVMAIYKYSDMQCTYSANMMSVLNGAPVLRGVWGIVAEWVKWRRDVLRKYLKLQVPRVEEAMRESLAFVTLMSKPECVSEVIELVRHKSDNDAIDYIMANYDNEIITRELAKWCIGRRLTDFRTGGRYAEKYESFRKQLETLNYQIEHVDEVIVSQLYELKNKYGHLHPRKTEVSTTDYDFTVEDSETAEKDLTSCTFSLKDGFFSKVRGTAAPNSSPDYVVYGNASDVLVAIDNRGRVLRIYCEDIPYNSPAELGTYLPRYMNLNESDDYRIWWIGKMDGREYQIVYKDGTMGFLDTKEWVGVNRKVKVLEKGISVAVADQVGIVLDEIPEAMYVTTNMGRLGYVNMSSVKHKDRTAKTRVFTLMKDEFIDSVAPMTLDDASLFIVNPAGYAAPKPQYIPEQSHILGDLDVFTECYA